MQLVCAGRANAHVASAETAVETAIDDSQGIETNSADLHSIMPSGRLEDVVRLPLP